MSMYDINNDGYLDAGVQDTTGDGILDQNVIDMNGDGVADTWLVDSNQDGFTDIRGYDTSGNGVIDVIDQDSDQNGMPEQRVLDLNEDSVADGTAPTPNMIIHPDGSITTASSYSPPVDLNDPAAVDAATGNFGDDIMNDLRNAPTNPGGPGPGSVPGVDPGRVADGIANIEANNSALTPTGTVRVTDPSTASTSYREPGMVTPESQPDGSSDGY